MAVVPFLSLLVAQLALVAEAQYRIVKQGSCAAHGLTSLYSPAVEGESDAYGGNSQCEDTPTYFECEAARKELHPTWKMSLWCSSANPPCWQDSSQMYYCASEARSAGEPCSESRPCVCKDGPLGNWTEGGAEPEPDGVAWTQGPCPKSLGLSGFHGGGCDYKTLEKCQRACGKAPDCRGLGFHAASSSCRVYYADASWEDLGDELCWIKDVSTTTTTATSTSSSAGSCWTLSGAEYDGMVAKGWMPLACA